jgi:hypothetical protein
MPITTPAAFTTPTLRRPRGARLSRVPTAWLNRLGGAALRLLRSGIETSHGFDPRMFAEAARHPQGACRRAPVPDPSLTAAFGGASRSFDLAFSPRGFASGWLDLRP